MSYTPVYSSRINWENEPSIASPINATNLNKMDYALKAHDDTLANWDITKANESDLLLSLKSVDYDTDTGEFVFTWWNGTTKTVDLNIEKIPVSFSMDANGVITMTTDDGTTYTADVGALIKTYTFTDSSEIDFTVTTDASGNKTITASIVAGSIDGTKLTPNYLADCTAAKTGAETAEGKAEGSAEDAEAWAVGTRGGVPVPSTDPAYENNAEYWAHHTSSSLAGLTDTDIDNPSDGEVLKYNGTTSKWENGQASAGGGSTITVTTSESSLYGQSVTISDGVTTLTETFSNIGEATFTGVTLTGTLTLASGGASRSISIPYFGNYSFILSLFTATVTVTYPAGASCTLSDGVTTLTGTGSPMAFSVPNAGTWTATVTLDGASKTDSAVITTDGQTASITIEYGTINVTYDNAFRGTSITCVQGGTTITKTAPSGANTMTFYPPTTGNWVISGTVSGQTYTTTASVTSLSTPVSVTLETVPDGSTVTPTDDIQTWLRCAGITDKAYTTLSEVLADSTSLLSLISDNNAVDYMVRSTTFAGSASGLVPKMTSNTTPSGECFGTHIDPNAEYAAYKSFDGSNSTTVAWVDGSTLSDCCVGYDFVTPTVVNRVLIKVNNYVTSVKIKASNDKSSWQDLGTINTFNSVVSFDNATAYRYYAIYLNTASGTSGWCGIYTIQFYRYGITTDSTAMTDVGADDYCAETLLSDATWCEAICNSTYFESVLNVKVPTMTSATTPSGVVSSSSEYPGDARFYNWKAFTNAYSTGWLPNYNTDSFGNAYIMYDFGKNVVVYKMMQKHISGGSGDEYTSFVTKLQGKSDGAFEDIKTGISTPTAGTAYNIITGSTTAYRYFKVTLVSGTPNSIGTGQGLKLQFYGREKSA